MTDVGITVPANSTGFFINDPPGDVERLLSDELSYQVENAEFTTAYKRGWDGRKRLYDKRDHTAPVGLLDRTIGLLTERGFDVSVSVEGDRTGRPIDPEWDFDHDLRDYQRRAVADVLSNHGGIVAIPTGGGKTAVGLKLIESVGQRAVVFVHSKKLLTQWADRIRDTLAVEPGVIGDSEWSEGPVTVAMMQTLMSGAEGQRRVGDLADDYGMAVFDECHRTGAAETMHAVGQAVSAPWRIGLSATPWRRVSGEELKIEGATGGIVSTVTAGDLIDAGHLARPEWRLIDPTDYGPLSVVEDGEDYDEAYLRCIELDPARNRAIAETVADLANDYRVLVAVRTKAHGGLLEYALSDGDLNTALERTGDRLSPRQSERFRKTCETARAGDCGAVFLSGESTTRRREETLEAFESGEIPVLISTLLREGADLPKLNAIILAEGGKSDVARIQRVGRALRPAGGDHAIVADVYDRGRWFGDHFRKRRETFASYYGDHGPEIAVHEGVETVRDYLTGEGVDLSEVSVYDVPAKGRVNIEIHGYIEDFSVIKETPAIRYDGETNYVRNPDALERARPA